MNKATVIRNLPLMMFVPLLLDHSKDLVTTDTQEILPQAVVEAVGKIRLRGPTNTNHLLRTDS